jgi:hypothetical protein
MIELLKGKILYGSSKGIKFRESFPLEWALFCSFQASVFTKLAIWENAVKIVSCGYKYHSSLYGNAI